MVYCPFGQHAPLCGLDRVALFFYLLLFLSLRSIMARKLSTCALASAVIPSAEEVAKYVVNKFWGQTAHVAGAIHIIQYFCLFDKSFVGGFALCGAMLWLFL